MPLAKMFPRTRVPLRKGLGLALSLVAALAAGWLVRADAQSAADEKHAPPVSPFDVRVDTQAIAAFRNGRHTFRFDTFGDEEFWGGQLQLHQAIEG